MNRHYTVLDFHRLIEKIRQAVPEIAIGLDVITGFPGETEPEFNNTCKLIESLPVSYLHVFPYSRRPGTPAADMPGQVKGDVARQRAAALRQLGSEKQRIYAEKFIGRSVEVVVESGNAEGRCKGLTRQYLPVVFSGDSGMSGQLQTVRLSGWNNETLTGELA